MKRLIDAYELMSDIEDHEAEFDCTGQSRAEMIDFVFKRIRLQKTVICVSDDFPECPKVMCCKDVMCGGACCEEP